MCRIDPQKTKENETFLYSRIIIDYLEFWTAGNNIQLLFSLPNLFLKGAVSKSSKTRTFGGKGRRKTIAWSSPQKAYCACNVCSKCSSMSTFLCTSVQSFCLQHRVCRLGRLPSIARKVLFKRVVFWKFVWHKNNKQTVHIWIFQLQILEYRNVSFFKE